MDKSTSYLNPTDQQVSKSQLGNHRTSHEETSARAQERVEILRFHPLAEIKYKKSLIILISGKRVSTEFLKEFKNKLEEIFMEKSSCYKFECEDYANDNTRRAGY